MSDDKKFLSQVIKRTLLKGWEAEKLLRRLLQSQKDGAAEGHLAAGRALFAAADSVPEIEKRFLYDQIFLCLMRALEDFAMLTLMGWDETRHPLDIYLNLDRPELRAFFTRARKGLGDEMILKLMGVGPLELLKKHPAFRELDLADDEDALDWATRDAQELLMRFGKLYHTLPEDADTIIGPWQTAFAKSPIGLKLLINLEVDEAEILIGSEQGDPATSDLSTVFTAPVKVDGHFAERVLEELEVVCRELKRLAHRRLLMMDDLADVAKEVKLEWRAHLNALAEKKGHPAPHPAPPPPPPAAAQEKPEKAAAEPVKKEKEKDKDKDSMRSSLIKPLAEGLNEEAEAKEDETKSPDRKVMDIGGLKIIHAKREIDK